MSFLRDLISTTAKYLDNTLKENLPANKRMVVNLLRRAIVRALRFFSH